MGSFLTLQLDYFLWSKTKFMEKKHPSYMLCFLSASHPRGAIHRPEFLTVSRSQTEPLVKKEKLAVRSGGGNGAMVT